MLVTKANDEPQVFLGKAPAMTKIHWHVFVLVCEREANTHFYYKLMLLTSQLFPNFWEQLRYSIFLVIYIDL